jgi:hypothetical protein
MIRVPFWSKVFFILLLTFVVSRESLSQCSPDYPFDPHCSLSTAGLNAALTPVHVPDNATLKFTSVVDHQNAVFRDGFYTRGDYGDPVLYTGLTGNCVANGLVNDNGSCVDVDVSVGGGSWKANLGGIKRTPKIWGCAGNGTTNDAVCLQAAITAVGGGKLYIGSGEMYKSNTGLTSAAQGFELVCDHRWTNGGGGTPSGLRAGVINLTMLTLTGYNHSVKDCTIDMGNNFTIQNTSGAAIRMPSALNGVISQVNILGPCTGIDLSGILATIEKSRITWLDSAPNCYGILLGHDTTGGTTVDARVNNTVIECSLCTTYRPDDGIRIEDCGGCFLNQTDVLTGQNGTHITPGANQDVIWLTAHNAYLADTGTSDGLWIETRAASARVIGLSFSQTWTSSSIGYGVYVSNDGGGIIDGIHFDMHRAYINGAHALYFAAGTNISVTNSDICANGTLTPNSFSGIVVAANINKVTLQGNRIRSACSGNSNQQFSGIYAIGAGDDWLIQNNDLTGNQSAGLTLGGTLTNSRIEGNAGYNPVGAAAITVTASPFTYTAGPAPESVYVKGGTVSAVTIGAQTACTASPCQLYLGPNETAVVTYTVAPTMAKSIH